MMNEDIILIILLISFFWLGLNTYGKIKKLAVLKKARLHLNDAPALADDLLDCYVKFHGRVLNPNQQITPLQEQPCVLYQSRVQAEWQTKLKKPQKGMTTNRKTLYKQESGAVMPLLELVGADGMRVQVDFERFQQVAMVELSLYKVNARQCPEICIQQAQDKYKTYVSMEKWLASHAMVMLYGRLEKDFAGQLFLVPTERADYPTVFKVNSKSGRKLDAELGKKAFLMKFSIAWRTVFLLGVGYLLANHLVIWYDMKNMGL